MTAQLHIVEDEPGLHHIEQAAKRIEGTLDRTPTRFSKYFSDLTGAQVYIKYENLHHTASFKERGALNKLLQLSDEERKAGVMAMSAGNHAQGVAYHAQRLGIESCIVMPRGTPFTKIEQTRAYGAQIILHGNNLEESFQFAKAKAAEEDRVFIHPYNDPQIIAGQGTMALEMLQDVPGLETLLIPVGGGGMIGGISLAARALQPEIEIVGVESENYAGATAALRGETLTNIGSTVAEGIALKTLGSLTLPIIQKHVSQIITCSENDIERAIAMLATHEKTVAEGAGATGVAALFARPDHHFVGRKVGIILSGGNIDARILASILMRDLVRQRRMISFKLKEEDRVGLFASVSRIVGDAGANIIEVAHNRLSLATSAKGVEVLFQVETRDSIHTNQVLDALRKEGFTPRELPVD